MPIETRWYIPERVILTQSHNEVTGDDMIKTFHQIQDFVQQGKPPIYIISDETAERTLTFNITALRDSFSYLKNSDIGYTISIGKADRITSFLSTVMNQLFKFNYQRFDTLEEAIAFLKKEDSTLNFEG